jgi:hypothetical protein
MNELDSRTIKRITDIKVSLTGRAMTTTELAATIHINTTSIQQYMRALLGNRVFIESWQRTPGHIVAAYRWGNGINARKPRGKTAAESERERLKNIQKDPDAYSRYLASHRARYARNKAVKKPNTWMSALFVGSQQGGRP